jgi:hypothetical protein
MSEAVVIGEERLVELHVVRSTIVFDPDAVNSWDCVVESRFKTECESAKYLTVCRSAAGVGVRVCKVGVSPAFATLVSPPFSTSAAPTPALGFASLLCKVLFGNALVAVVVRVVSISTVSALGGV